MKKDKVSKSNEGIVQSGGSINAGALAVGRSAEAVSYGSILAPDLETLRQQIRELRSMLGTDVAKDLDPSQGEAAAKLVKVVENPHPEKKSLLQILSTIGSAARGISGITSAVELIRKGVEHLL